MKREYTKIFQDIERMIHSYNEIEKRKRNYGLDYQLTCTEIHIIDEIGRQPGIGVKGIAISKGVTEGAISQLVKKLIGKELIIKQISEESEAKVNLYLTEKGKICFREHMKFHEEFNQKWYGLLDQINDEDYLKLTKLLNQIDRIMEGL